MAQKEYNKEEKRYQHLSESERGEIKAYLKEGYGVTVIAKKIGRDKSTVSRELKRGRVEQKNSDLTVR